MKLCQFSRTNKIKNNKTRPQPPQANTNFKSLIQLINEIRVLSDISYLIFIYFLSFNLQRLFLFLSFQLLFCIIYLKLSLIKLIIEVSQIFLSRISYSFGISFISRFYLVNLVAYLVYLIPMFYISIFYPPSLSRISYFLNYISYLSFLISYLVNAKNKTKLKIQVNKKRRYKNQETCIFPGDKSLCENLLIKSYLFYWIQN